MSAQPPQWQPPPHQQRPQPGQQPQGPQQRPPQGPPQPPRPGGRRANSEPERPTPPGPRGPARGRTVLAATLSIVLLIGTFSLVTWAAIAAAKERERIAAQPSPTPYSVPKSADPTKAPPKNVLATLPLKPDLCGKLQTALPAELRPGEGQPNKTNDKERQNCRWGSLNKQEATWVSVEVIVYPDSDPATAMASANEELDDEKDYAADTKSNGGFHKNVHDVTGIGDEAFGDDSSNIITTDDVGEKEDKINYNVAGAHLFVRWGNVNIEVNYLGATYPESQNVKNLRGTNLTYAQAEPKAKQIVETIIEQLQ